LRLRHHVGEKVMENKKQDFIIDDWVFKPCARVAAGYNRAHCARPELSLSRPRGGPRPRSCAATGLKL
jgi:hypothetical protein